MTFDEGLQAGSTWSPDGRYIAYSSDQGGKFDIWVQQVSGGDPIQITKRPGQNLQPDWSPDGKTIYFVSQPGGFFNVWGMRFDPSTGKTIDKPFQVSKFDSERLRISSSIPPVGLSLTQDKLVLTMAEESGNIWILDNVDR